MTRNKRILLIAEPLRRSNAARLAILGRALHAAGYTVILAASPESRERIGEVPFTIVPLRSALSREERKARWRAMMPLYDVDTLEAYVRQDKRLMRMTAPDLVIGDMRPSLPISAREMGARFAVIVDATFSDACQLPFELPHLPFLENLGRGPAQNLFDVFVGVGMFMHALPSNLARLNHGMAGWHADVRQSYTDADLVIYPNIPQTVPMDELPATHKFIGPILSVKKTPVPEPVWWPELPEEGPIIWVNLSSADPNGHAAAVLDGLAGVDATVTISAALSEPILQGRSNVLAGPNLQSAEMNRRAKLVITNADTTVIQQSLAAGTPVLVVPEPEESIAYANAIRAKGAAEVLHSAEATSDAVRLVATRMLAEPAFRAAAAEIAKQMAKYDASARFVEFVDHVFEAASRENAA